MTAAEAYARGRHDERAAVADWVRYPPGRPTDKPEHLLYLGALADSITQARHVRPSTVTTIDANDDSERAQLIDQLDAANDRIRKLERALADSILRDTP